MDKLKSLKGSVIFHLALITLAGLLAYSNIFNVPFQWDDKLTVVDNEVIKDFQFFIHPSEAKDLQYYKGFRNRFVGHLTFALNYASHGLNVTGYHVVNLAIHIFNAFLVYFLVVLTFRTPYLLQSKLCKNSGLIALFTGLLFVSHPVQTQAVTYISQRFTSLAAMFCLLSISSYVRSRLSSRSIAKYSLYALSLMSALLAMKTKENTLTLPLMAMLYEFMFLKGSPKKRVLSLLPLILTMLVIPLSILDFSRPFSDALARAINTHVEISRFNYSITQFRVIMTYLRLLVLPVNQSLDYDYPVYSSFFDPPVLLSFLFLLSVIGLGFLLIKYSRSGEATSRLSAFGIFWFFLALSVESSIIPLHVIFEHRIYLPSAGVFIAVVAYGFSIADKVKNRQPRIMIVVMSVFVLIIITFVCATYARNTIWQSRTSLWKDVVKKSPENIRGHINLGIAYKIEDTIDKAMEQWQRAIRIKPDSMTHQHMALAYSSKGLIDNAIEHLQAALILDPYSVDAHRNIGVAYTKKGLPDKAITHYHIALQLQPNDAETHYNLGIAYASKGLVEKALEHYKAAIRIRPAYGKAHNNLGALYKAEGYIDNAINHYQIALGLTPGDARIHNNLGNIYDDLGMTEKAIEHYKTALKLNPDFAEAHYNLGIVYLRKGDKDNARRELKSALTLSQDIHSAQRLLDNISKASPE